MTSEEKLGDSSFYVHLAGMKAVLLYPALTTPALVDEEGVLTVILAVDQDACNNLQIARGKHFTPQTPINLFEALKFHSQLLLVPWGNGHSKGFVRDYDKKDEKEKDTKEFFEFYNGINTFKNTIFGGPIPCMEAFENGKNARGKEKGKPFVRGAYIGPMHESSFVQIQRGSDYVPFGVLADAAVKMYIEAGYTHLFCLEFGNFPVLETVKYETGDMYELVWLYVARPPEDPEHQYENPSDTVLVENFAKNINPFAPGSKEIFLKENVDTRPQKILKKRDGSPEDLDLFRLRSAGIKKEEEEALKGDEELAKLTAPSGVNLAELPWITQKGGWLLYSRHPVFFKKKITRFAAMSDLHLSSRQTLYKMVKAQVIPGVSEKDSPHIGKMAHDNFSSVRDLMGQLCRKADALLIAGDIYDHRQNLDPRICLQEKKLTNTADLWGLLEFGKYKDDENEEAKYYPKHIDGLMMLELILGVYASEKAKPVFFIAGNHEGYQYPYGISPRLTEEVARLNAGIPTDHNLSFYEAILLFGPTYKDFSTGNFSRETMEWLYQTFTPWSDFYISQKNFNLVGLGWGKDETIFKTTAKNASAGVWGALSSPGRLAVEALDWALSSDAKKNEKFEEAFPVTLPTAGEAISDQQKKLVDHAAGQAETKRNILFSHFTHINYNGDFSFRDQNGNPEKKNITITMGITAEDKANTGSFRENQHAMYDLREANKIHYSISGHSHRAGIYSFKYIKPDPDKGMVKKIAGAVADSAHRSIQTMALSKLEEPHKLLENYYFGKNDEVFLKPPVANSSTSLRDAWEPLYMRSIALVCGSAGPMACQNMAGEFLGMGMDAPQGLILDIDQQKVDFVRWKSSKLTSKPRFSVLMANLCHFREIKPFSISKFEKIITEYPPNYWEYNFINEPEEISYKKVYTCDIYTWYDDESGKSMARVRPGGELWDVFEDWPIQSVKVFMVNPKRPNKTEYLSIDFSSLPGRDKPTKDTYYYGPVEFSVNEEDADEEGLEHGETIVYFAAIFFTPPKKESGALIREYYETQTAWCLPATVEEGTEEGEFFITLDYREVPDLKFMENSFQEFAYKKKKKVK